MALRRGPQPAEAVLQCEGESLQRCGGSMAVCKDLLDILVCPMCKTPVKLTPDSQGLKCWTCRRVYPIRDDIPVMLVDEARVEGS